MRVEQQERKGADTRDGSMRDHPQRGRWEYQFWDSWACASASVLVVLVTMACWNGTVPLLESKDCGVRGIAKALLMSLTLTAACA